MVSAWSSSLQLLMGQVKTNEKSNEITAIPELLRILDLKDKVITKDAMGCQVSTAEQIVNEGGHYILALKGNQETIHEEVKAIFNHLDEKRIWILDMAFKEDNFQGHTGHLTENFSLLQRLTLVKQESSLKKSIVKKRERAGWNNDYLLKILGV